MSCVRGLRDGGIMKKEEVADKITELLRESGLGLDDQIKAISMARAALMPRAGIDEWRDSRKPLTKPSQKAAKG